MAHKIIARNPGNFGRVNVSASDLEKLEAETSDDIDIDVADTEDVAQTFIDSKDVDRFLITTPQ